MPPIEVIAVAFVAAFIADLIGNIVSFGSRLGNAIASAIVFAIMFAAASYFTGQIDLDGNAADLQLIGFAAVLFFIIGFIGNLIAFGNRFVNALVTAILFAAIFVGAYYGLTEFAGSNFLKA